MSIDYNKSYHQETSFNWGKIQSVFITVWFYVKVVKLTIK